MAQEHPLGRQQAGVKVGAQAGATVAEEVGGTLGTWIQKIFHRQFPYGQPAETDAEWMMKDSAYCPPGLADD